MCRTLRVFGFAIRGLDLDLDHGTDGLLSITDVVRFLANVNSRSRSLYAIARPSVVCRLSVCL